MYFELDNEDIESSSNNQFPLIKISEAEPGDLQDHLVTV